MHIAYFSIAVSLLIALIATGCSTLPSVPSVIVLPGSGRSFDQFRSDDAICRQFAYTQVGGKTGSNDAAAASGAANRAIDASQQHYDVVYIQCMYAKGHQVPVTMQYSSPVLSQPSKPVENFPPQQPVSPSSPLVQ